VSAPAALSVAIVAYRTPAAMLARALDSLAIAAREARQAGVLGALDVFVVDNGETAGDRAMTLEAAREWPADAGTLDIVAGHGNVGYGRANNLVLPRVRSDIHLVMNPDVELDRGALRAGLEALARHPQVGLVAPAVVDGNGGRQYLCRRYP
jgi:GT2 family glycosyltransferase